MKQFLLALALLPSLAFAKLPSEDDTPNAPREAGPLSRVYREEADILAGPEMVWNIIMDLDRYEEWNPWVIHAEGNMEKGGIVFVDVKLGLITMHAKHVVLLNQPYERFCWRDAGWNANFAYGQRCRTLTVQEDGRVHFTNEIIVDGILSGVANLFQGKDLQKGLKAETQALKERAELFMD